MIKKNDERVIWTDKPHNFFGLPLNFTRYLITSEKLIIRHGFLNITEDEVLLYRIMDKKVLRPVTQRIFGCSTLVLAAKDIYQSEVILKKIKNIDRVVEKLDELIKESRQANRVVGREYIESEAECD